MEAINSDVIREMRDNLKKISDALKEIEACEEKQEVVRNINERDNLEARAKDSSLAMMKIIEELVNSTSLLGCCHDAYDINTYHRIQSYDIRETL